MSEAIGLEPSLAASPRELTTSVDEARIFWQLRLQLPDFEVYGQRGALG